MEYTEKQLELIEKMREKSLQSNKTGIIVCCALFFYVIPLFVAIGLAVHRRKIKDLTPDEIVKQYGNSFRMKHLMTVASVPSTMCETFYFNSFAANGVFTVMDEGIVVGNNRYCTYKELSPIMFYANNRKLSFVCDGVSVIFNYESADQKRVEEAIAYANAKINAFISDEIAEALQAGDAPCTDIDLGTFYVTTGDLLTFRMGTVHVSMRVCESSKRFALLREGKMVRAASFTDIERLYTVTDTSLYSMGQATEDFWTRAVIGTSNYSTSMNTTVRRKFAYYIVTPSETLSMDVPDPQTLMQLRTVFERNTGLKTEQI